MCSTVRLSPSLRYLTPTFFALTENLTFRTFRYNVSITDSHISNIFYTYTICSKDKRGLKCSTTGQWEYEELVSSFMNEYEYSPNGPNTDFRIFYLIFKDLGLRLGIGTDH